MYVLRSKSEIIIQSTTNQCWLKNAFHKGDFVVFSHRSFFSTNEIAQLSCKEALTQLRNIGVHALDLDLVLDGLSDNSKILVSHPIEFKRQSNNYSPCSLLPLDHVIFLLDEVYGEERNWFFSLEPKASCGRTQNEMNDFALVEPFKIMSELLRVIMKNKLDKNQCAVIIDVNTIKGHEEYDLSDRLLQHCQLFIGKRKSDQIQQ